MTEHSLALKLRQMYDLPGVKKTTMIHLFGIIYADEIQENDLSLPEILKAANMHDSYKTEIRKGMNLSPFVELKASYKAEF